MLFALTRKLKAKIKEAGIAGTLKVVVATIKNRYPAYLRRKEGENFDRRFKTDTQFLKTEDEIFRPADPERYQYFRAYAPSSVSTGRNALLSLSAIPLEEFLFVDIGSGKGRVLLIASDFPFKKITGIEFIPHYHEIALRNIAIYRNDSQKCFSLESTCIDATLFPIPEEKIVFFLFNPFPAKLMSQFISATEESLERCPREILIIYVNPIHRHLMDRSKYFSLIKEEKGHGTCSAYCIYSSKQAAAAQLEERYIFGDSLFTVRQDREEARGEQNIELGVGKGQAQHVDANK